MLAAAGIEARPPACALIAYIGDDPTGAAGVETAVDVGLITILFVAPSMRGRGIGAQLMRAARVAAHTRGARTLFKIGPPDAAGYLARFGFEPIDIAAAAQALEDIAEAELLREDRIRAWRLDISKDGIIER